MINGGVLATAIIEVHAPLELVYQQRDSFGSPPLMSNRILYFNFIKHRPIVEGHQEGVPDGTLRWVMVIDAKSVIFFTEDLGTKSINPRIGGGGIRA
jgi:hypothetical protein